MGIAYVLSADDAKIKDVLYYEDYEFLRDINFYDKSYIEVPKKPNITTEDYIFCRDGEINFNGICETVENVNGENLHTIRMYQIERLFDRNVILDNEAIVGTVGIEDFIKAEIEDKFINSDDDFINKGYITVTASTHNTVAAKVPAPNGIYNIKTYIGNAKENYSIFLDFYFSNGALSIDIHKKTQTALSVDTTLTDIIDLSEIYQVNVLSKLQAIWQVTESEDPPTLKTYYLLNNRSITEDGEDENRAKGYVNTIYIEAETEAELYQQVLNAFRSNSYKHSVEFEVRSGSKILPLSELFVGRECMIKSKDYGVKNSIITRTDINSKKKTIGLKFGNLQIRLIEKIRS